MINEFEFYKKEYKRNANLFLFLMKLKYSDMALANEEKTQKINPNIKPKLSPARRDVIVDTISKLYKFIGLFNDITVDNNAPYYLWSYVSSKKLLGLDDEPTPTDAEQILEQWAHISWGFLHSASIVVYFSKSKKMYEGFIFMYYNFYVYLMCGVCEFNYQRKNEREDLLNKCGEDVITLIYKLHNIVNGGVRMQQQPPTTFSKLEFLALYKLSLRERHVHFD
jgi:hypothetical protein